MLTVSNESITAQVSRSFTIRSPAEVSSRNEKRNFVDFLYSPQLMNSMFLTAYCERFLEADAPVEDRVTLSEVEPMQHWLPLFPVKPQQSCCGGSDGGYLMGTIYVCPKRFPNAWLSHFSGTSQWIAIYYGIRYDLEIDNDRLTGQSDVYMGALYRTRKLAT